MFNPEKNPTEQEEVFNKFDDSIEGAKAKLDERKNMSFKELAKDMGYDV